MRISGIFKWMAVTAMLAMTVSSFGAALPAELKASVEARVKAIETWSSDPAVVGAVKACNQAPSPEAQAMTNEKWKGLTLLDPFVRSFSKNPLGEFLKRKKDETIAEIFVSAANGDKVAFLSKTTSWNHKGKDKHQVPMTGKVWYGPVEVDESSGQQQIQVGFPVLDNGKPIGSLVVGFSVAKLK